MDRTPPAAANEEIELYIRTIYSLMRSSGPIRLRSLEESHIGMNSSLHQLAGQPRLDVAALTYSAMRLPPCFPDVQLVVMGQMEEVFSQAGFGSVEDWPRVFARARRRRQHFDAEKKVLAAFIASVSDIDDIVPVMVTYQIEWNKMNLLLRQMEPPRAADLSQGTLPFEPGQLLREGMPGAVNGPPPDAPTGPLSEQHLEGLRHLLQLSPEDFLMLQAVWPGPMLLHNLRRAAQKRLDVRAHILGSGLSDYRRAVQVWWRNLERTAAVAPAERPIYFVSSNTHSLVNLLSGYAWQHEEEIVEFVQAERPENLWEEHQRLQADNRDQYGNFLYYAARLYTSHPAYGEKAQAHAFVHEEEAGICRFCNDHTLDLEAQCIEISRLQPDWFDTRLGSFSPEEKALLRQSDALILNIDYPLGMAAYHLLSQVSTAVSRLLGVYILGKAATLNGRVGDVMIPNVVHDEHSKNTFLFRNCFSAQDVAPFLNYGTVFDNQKAVTVRGTILQNRDFMHVFYEESYTDIEMEAGPYLSAVYEDIYPKRYPCDEIVNIFINAPYDIGILHYASDTPISRRQELLSKSLSYFGVDATYATSIPVVQRILRREIARQAQSVTAESYGL